MSSPDERGADPVVERYKLDLDRSLIRASLRRSIEERAAGRPKDFEAIAELEAIQEERGRS
jgi:hypothetical protein